MSIKNISFSLLCVLGVGSTAYASDTNLDDPIGGAPRVSLQAGPDRADSRIQSVIEDLETTYKEDVAPALKRAEQDVRHEVKPVLKDAETTYKEDVAPALKKAEQDVRHQVKPVLKDAEKSIKKVFGRKKK
ncbi:MAG: hypothetical protein KBB83_01440 [Alphaproteobacteria bacterium]|nr:hypothetical protein [Alphaproteobacteria bacterium]